MGQLDGALVDDLACAQLVDDASLRKNCDEYNGQSYKASTLVNYYSRVVRISNLLVITTLES